MLWHMGETKGSKDKGSKLYHSSQNPGYTTAGLVHYTILCKIYN